MSRSDTSAEAFHSLSVAGYLQPKEKQVLQAFKSARDTFTRQQLVSRAGLPLSSICGRVRSLLDKKALAVRGDCIDPVTHKRQELLGLALGGQKGLF